MRRLNPAKVLVKAPSRGLVTRWPGETADQLASGVDKFSLPGMANRASTVASNVRYQDGVVKNAPGYAKIVLPNTIIAHWPLDELTGVRFDTAGNHLDLTEQNPPVNETPGLINGAARFDIAGPDISALIISDYTPGELVNPFAIGETPEWDGTFHWFATNDLTDLSSFKYYGSEAENSLIVSMGGVCLIQILRQSDHWVLDIGGPSNIWHGVKLTDTDPTDPTGVYTNDGTGDANPDSPATFTVAIVSGAITQTDFQSCES